MTTVVLPGPTASLPPNCREVQDGPRDALEFVKGIEHVDRGNTATADVLHVSGPQLAKLTNARLQAALCLLTEARDYARDVQRDLWDFAVEVSELRCLGLNVNDLRWLVCSGFIHHGQEISQPGEDHRQFRSGKSLKFNSRSCFVINEGRAVDTVEKRPEQINRPQRVVTQHLQSAEPRIPAWDVDLREVRYAGRLIKRYKLPSPNQETVLMAFEEEGWPRRIDDPLPAHPDQDAKRRLHDTIRSLNRNQKEGRLRFKGDGTGEGILWEVAPFDYAVRQ